MQIKLTVNTHSTKSLYDQEIYIWCNKEINGSLRVIGQEVSIRLGVAFQKQ